MLAIVAIATAFSGYQGTQWGGEQARLYGLASSTRFEAEAASTLGGQELVADSSFFTAWLQAHEADDRQLEAMLEGRFTPEYADAFDDWLATDPFTNPDAPPGPRVMPGYREPLHGEGREAERPGVRVLRRGHGRAGDRQQVRPPNGAVRVGAVPRRDRAAVPAAWGADRRERTRAWRCSSTPCTGSDRSRGSDEAWWGAASPSCDESRAGPTGPRAGSGACGTRGRPLPMGSPRPDPPVRSRPTRRGARAWKS